MHDPVRLSAALRQAAFIDRQAFYICQQPARSEQEYYAHDDQDGDLNLNGQESVRLARREDKLAHGIQPQRQWDQRGAGCQPEIPDS